MRPRSKKAIGFTLLEVIVTLSIISISLTVLYKVFSSVARGTRVSSDYYTAVQIAESEMAKLKSQAGSLGGNSGVVDDYFYWSTAVSSYSLPIDSPLALRGALTSVDLVQQPYLYSVRVSWGTDRERNYELNTIHFEGEP